MVSGVLICVVLKRVTECQVNILYVMLVECGLPNVRRVVPVFVLGLPGKDVLTQPSAEGYFLLRR